MHQFLRPFRRKLGVLVLVLARGVTGLWVRSQVAQDTQSLPVSNRFIQFESSCGRLWVGLIVEGWMSTPEFYPPLIQTYVRDDELDNLDFELAEFWPIINHGPSYFAEVLFAHFVTFPNWLVANPLTLISAWLLLSPLRKSNPLDRA